MSGDNKKSGGEAGGARLLHLARRELLESVLPAVEGDARYRLRLIANAMKVAAREIEAGAAAAEATANDLEAFAGQRLGTAAGGPAAARLAIRDALRDGRLDADAELFRLLEAQVRRRRDLLS